MSTAPFRILRFWTEYQVKNGKTIAYDMVEYCPIGQAHRTTIPARIDDLKRVRLNPDPDDIAGNMALHRWRFIEQAYNSWKTNNEVPVDGTPLAAWPGITSSQAEVLKQTGLRSVEDIANATDAIIGRVALPGFREIMANAKRFLENKDKAAVSEELAKKDREMEAMRAEMEEMKRVLYESMQQEPELLADGSEAPRARRGRPPKAAAA